MKFTTLGLASALVALAGCSKSPGLDPRTQPVSVLVVRVGAPIAETESFTGVVTARVQSDLGFRVPGKVTKRFVDTGQKVHIGEPLMQIDVTDYAHAIATQTENVAALRAKAKQAAADEVRYRGLVSTGAIAASTYDQVKATADAAQAQLASAEAQKKVARDQGDYSLLLADSDGTVVQTLAEPGQVVAAGQTVVKLAHAGPREAAVYLPETLRPSLGSEAHAVLYGETASVPVRLRQLSDSADPETRTFEARYVLGSLGANAPLWSYSHSSGPKERLFRSRGNRSTRGRAAETHATRARLHHNGPVWKCLGLGKTQSQSANRATPLEKACHSTDLHSINKGNCVAVPLIGQFWTVAASAQLPVTL
jgi:RND family efflux transporter MFP subunit